MVLCVSIPTLGGPIMSIEDEEAAMWDDETAWAAEQERLEKLWEQIE